MPNNCQFRKSDGSLCKRGIAEHERFCWQHASGLMRKWRSLTRNQSIAFVLGILSLVGLPSAYWSYKGSKKSASPASSTSVVQSNGANSPNILGNQGPVTIDSGDSATKKKQTKESPKSEGEGK